MGPSLFGYLIDSDLSLRRAPRLPEGASRGVLRVRRAGKDVLAREGELVSWDERDGAAFALATSGGDLLAWCSVTGSYLMRDHVIMTNPLGGAAEWEHRLAATIVPLLLSEHGDLCLHAAAAVDQEQAIVFCGPAGAGKSTLSAALALGGRQVVSEDGVVLSGLEDLPIAWPGARGVRITSDALAVLRAGASRLDGAGAPKEIQLLGPGERAPRVGAVPVGAIVLLEPRGGDGPQLERLDAVSALPALMPHVLHGGPTRLAAAMRRAASAAARVPVFRARVPEDLQAAARNAEALLRLVRSGARRRVVG